MSVVEFEPHTFDFSLLHNHNFGLCDTKLEEINYIKLSYSHGYSWTYISTPQFLNWLKAAIKQWTCIKAYY